MPTTPTKVVIHPIVLLSTVDHYNRVAKDTQKRVVGILLGSSYKGVVDVTNSYAGSVFLKCCLGNNKLTVPFDEDLRNPKIWFLDHNYHEQMCSMFKKINGAVLLSLACFTHSLLSKRNRGWMVQHRSEY